MATKPSAAAGVGDSARKRAEITRAHLASIIESSDDAIISKDLEGIVTSWNAGAECIFGYSATEMIGRPVTLLIPPENPDEESRCISRIKGGERIEHYETCCVRKDGRRIDVSLTVLPIKDATGNIIGASKIARDITERKRADEELRRSRQELIDFIENATIGMHWVRDDGTILWANQTEMKMLGYAPDEYIGHNIIEFHVDIDLINNLLQRLKRNETLEKVEVKVRCKDGSIRYVLLDSNVLWIDGRFIHTRCFSRDITERKLAEQALQDSEQQLREALEEREQLSQDLHDGIVQEIYAIGLGLEEAQRLVAEHAKQAERKISDAIAGLNEVIRDVREHIIGSAPHFLTGAQFSAELAALAKTMRNAHSLRFRFDIDAMAISRLSDDAAPHILNITREAISNSLRHSEGHSGLVSLQLHHDGVRLVVEDDGTGFDLEGARVRGQGLQNIEARAEKLAAKLHIRSGTGDGTRIVLDIPAEHTDAAP